MERKAVGGEGQREKSEDVSRPLAGCYDVYYLYCTAMPPSLSPSLRLSLDVLLVSGGHVGYRRQPLRGLLVAGPEAM